MYGILNIIVAAIRFSDYYFNRKNETEKTK